MHETDKILVLGATSFAGSAFIDYCLSQKMQVIGVSRSEELKPAFCPYFENPNRDRFHYIQADLNLDLKKIVGVLEEFQPAYVVDYAGQGMVANSWDHPEQWFQTNVVAKVSLHDQLRKMPFLKRYVKTSTPEIYGSTPEKITEDFPDHPSTPYAVSHAAIDMSLQTFLKNYGFPVVFTRSANFCGPYQQLYRIIPRTIIYAKLGKKLSLHGGGHSVRCFVHVRDVSRATWLVMKESPPGEIYHIANEEYISIRDLVAEICSQMGIAFEKLVEPSDERAGKDGAYLLSTEKIRHKLGWESTISIQRAIAETIEWIERNWDVIKDSPLDFQYKK